MIGLSCRFSQSHHGVEKFFKKKRSVKSLSSEDNSLLPGQSANQRGKKSSPATVEQCSAVGAALQTAFRETGVCYRLQFDETSKELHHDWGFVFVVFRELLFLQPPSGHVTRFIIGYD